MGAETKVTVNEADIVAPRMRVSKQASMNITTAWQRIDFDGLTSLDVNLFPFMSNGLRQVYWDSVNKVFKFNPVDHDRNFDIRFGTVFSQGLTIVNMQLRFVVPAPTPLYFPFPLKADDATLQGRGYTDLNQLPAGVGTDYGTVYKDNLYSNALARAYGVGIEMKASANITNMPVMKQADFVIFGQS